MCSYYINEYIDSIGSGKIYLGVIKNKNRRVPKKFKIITTNLENKWVLNVTISNEVLDIAEDVDEKLRESFWLKSM